MEADVSQDFEDYWNEYRTFIDSSSEHYLHEDDSSASPDGECSDERDWLEAAGLSDVTEPAFLSGREVSEKDLERTLRLLSREQVAAVRRRVESLNKTVRQRARTRHRTRKPDIRDVFRDVESWSNDSRSRSATPDSLDSDPPSPPSPPQEHFSSNDSHNVRFGYPGVVMRNEAKRRIASNTNGTVLPHHALFRRSSRTGGDVASEMAEGIRMVAYQRIGSVRVRCGSDPIDLSTIGPDLAPPNSHPVVSVSRSDEGLFESSRRHSGSSSSDTLGFEEMWAGNSLTTSIVAEECESWKEGIGRTWVDFLAEEDLVTLRPLVFLELTALMDSCGIRVGKTKSPKRKRKEDGALFGVSLGALLEKDQQIVAESHNVPLVFQKVLGELERRGVWEEGILRVGGNRQKVEALCTQLEREFYTRPEVADHLLISANAHELATLLKRLIRDLPQPLLTTSLLPLFYQAHGVPDCVKALNLLVLLLPTEHRATLYSLLTFLSNVVDHQEDNKMSMHNVAMIIAPSLFPPDALISKSGLKAQVSLAAQCCTMTELMMQATDRLWIVPDSLIAQLRDINDNHKYQTKENKPKSRLLGRKGHVVSRKIVTESNLQAGLIHIEAPQFLVNSLSVTLDKQTTASSVILRVVQLAREVPRCVKSTRRDLKSRALSELAPNGNLSCLLSTGDAETALQTHFLYEIGGNIGQRRLEQTAQLLAVYQNNPNAQWIIKCDHRNGSHRILKRV